MTLEGEPRYVWLVFKGWDRDVVGVFASEESAVAYTKTWMGDRPLDVGDRDERTPFWPYVVERREVQS